MSVVIDGTNGITVNGTKVATSIPAFSAYASTGTSLPNTTPTKIVFQTEEFDTNNNFDNTNGRFTPTVPGYYTVTATVGSNGASASAYFQASIYKNGAVLASSPVSAGLGIYVNTVSAVVYCNGTTDYLEVFASQVTGATQTSLTGTIYKFSGCLVRGS